MIIFTCSMHPDVAEDRPGKCPECHMVLEKQKVGTRDTHGIGSHPASHGKGGHTRHNPNSFRDKFWLSLALTIPVLLYSQAVMDLLDFRMPKFAGSEWVPAILGIVIFFYGGLVFIRGAKAELAARMPGMMTLISVAIAVSFGYSLAVTLKLIDGMDFWWELATLVTIMLLGHWLEMASISNAQGALEKLSRLIPDEAERITDDGVERVAILELVVGDRVLVRPGSSIPIDGEVIEGESDVDESMLTGESKPIRKNIKDAVIAGTINGSGSLTVIVTRIGDETTLAGIMKLVRDAQKSKSRTQILADRAAFYLTFISIAAAIITLIGWALFSDRSVAFILERVVTVLIIACPHALGLAIPLVAAISTALAAQNGLLVVERTALEIARNIDVVLFDKTGTLTRGEQGVVSIASVDSDENNLLALAASVEAGSEHPIAKAIVRSAAEMKIALSSVKGFSALSGRGVRATVNGEMVYTGGPRLLEELGVKLPANLKTASAVADNEGKTVVYVISGKRILGAIMLADVVRDESREAVRLLQQTGKRVAMLTGDSRGVAAWVARELGIKDYFAEVLPEGKAKVVSRLQADGSKVAMVGDGINDAPALAQANIGIAIGAGTDVAIESADIILASNDPRGVIKVVKLSRATYRKMIQNLGWATGYNIIAIPLAAGVAASHGFILSPALGAILMSASTIIVAFNAQLLRRTDLNC